MKKPVNPFVTAGYYGAKYFCDREAETKSLLQNITNELSTTLIAIRRIGKTGLIRHVLAKLPPDYTSVYVDILPTEDMNELLNVLVSSIINSIPQRTGPGKKMMDFIKSLRPVITYDPLSGIPQVTIDVRKGEAPRHIDSVFSHLEKYPKKIVIAIDEFQQILEYPEKNADAWLRSSIQTLKNVTFIFSGSRQHLMDELFSDPSKPFYRSTSLLNIGKINSESYSVFIIRHFKNSGKKIEKEVVEEILEWTDVHTYYVQLLCNRVFAAGGDQITSEIWKAEAHKLLEEQELLFLKYRDLLSFHQWQLLKAIAREGEVYSPSSKEFVSKHSLGSPATVLRSLGALLRKQMIYANYDQDKRVFYKVYDLLLRRWLEE